MRCLNIGEIILEHIWTDVGDRIIYWSLELFSHISSPHLHKSKVYMGNFGCVIKDSPSWGADHKPWPCLLIHFSLQTLNSLLNNGQWIQLSDTCWSLLFFTVTLRCNTDTTFFPLWNFERTISQTSLDTEAYGNADKLIEDNGKWASPYTNWLMGEWGAGVLVDGN